LSGNSFGTDNIPNQWIYVNLINYLVIPTSYRLGNTRQGNCHPRNWRLDASVDGDNWITLRTHEEDKTFSNENIVGNWDINDTSQEKYQYFRIYQTGFSEGGYYHLSCCCFEIYGRVFKKQN